VVDAARSRGAIPAGVVDALRVTGLVGRALAAEHGLAPRTLATVGTREHGAEAGARELRVTATAAPLAALLADARIGRAVLDATTDARTLGAVLGCDVAVHHLAVADGAQVTAVGRVARLGGRALMAPMARWCGRSCAGLRRFHRGRAGARGGYCGDLVSSFAPSSRSETPR
jgi:hypothetical protein